MLSSQMASSQAPQLLTTQELMAEIAFQKVLLSSIDDTVDNREASEKEIRHEIKKLEKQMKNLRRSTQEPLQSLQSRNMEGSLSRDQWQTLTSASSTASTPKSASSLRDTVRPSRIDLPNRKRTHTNVDHLGPYEGNKSRRTSPSPFHIRELTPSTSSGDEEFEHFDAEFFNQQKAEESRIKSERMDAEFARSIQNEPQQFGSMSLPPSSIPSALDQISGVRLPPPMTHSMTPSTGTSSKRKLPWKSPLSSGPGAIKPEPSSMATGVKRKQASDIPMGFTSYASMNSDNGFRVETKASSSSTMPGSFPHYASDAADAGDSDVEIIPSTSFQPNRRHHNPNMAMYGKQALPKWMNSQQQDSLTHSRRPLIGTSSSLYPGLQIGKVAANSAPRIQMHGPALGGYVYPSSSIGNGIVADGMGGSHGMHAGFYNQGLGHNKENLPGPAHAFDSFDFDPHRNTVRPMSTVDGNETSIFSNPMDLRMAEQVDHIMGDPRKTNQEIKELLENIRPDVDLPPEDREGTPVSLKYGLYEHQKLALTWLKSMEEGTNKGGILADDMGLGKTISALALMLTRPSSDALRKTNLIVGPVALVRQWEREIRTKVKAGYKLSVHMVHGQGKKISWDELRNFDVVLTTYGTLGAENRRLETFLEKERLDGIRDWDQAPMRKTFPLLGPKSLFYRVFLDEAQCIKNKNTNAARACCMIKSIYRFCLTGTPMMNNVGELYSLIHFLRIKPFNEHTRFQQTFGMLTKGDAGKSDVQGAMRKLQALLKSLLLRRVKTSLIDGKPIITLPPKTEEIQHVVFDDDEQAFYNALETKTQLQFNKYLKAGTVGKNYSNVLVLLLRLRQACCHPHLIHDFEEATPAGVDLSADDMIELAKTLAPNVVARLLAAEDSFECPVCYDGVPNPAIVVPCGHDTCSECLTRISDQAGQQDVANGNEAGAGGSKCPTCRGKIEMNKVIDYITFKKVYKPGAVGDGIEVETASESSDPDMETDSDSEIEDDANSDGDLRNFIVPDVIEEELLVSDDDEDRLRDCDGDDEAEVVPKESKVKGKKEGKKFQPKAKKLKKSKKKGKAKEKKKEHVSIAMLKKEASKSAEGRRRYMRHLRKNWQPSAKVTKCIELLERFQHEGERTIIFSQFVSLLDLLQVPIDQKGWDCERYDGGMSGEARNNAIVRFTDKPDTKIMLISLKAGNAGINLVAASRVIILDPFWNPFIEMQAVDRAYRIGQQKPVEVHRILIKSTVEDRIIELQERKRKLVNAALDEGASKSLGRLDVRQLAFLFGVGNGT